MPRPSRMPTAGGRCAMAGVSSTSTRSKTRFAFARHLLGRAASAQSTHPRGAPRRPAGRSPGCAAPAGRSARPRRPRRGCRRRTAARTPASGRGSAGRSRARRGRGRTAAGRCPRRACTWSGSGRTPRVDRLRRPPDPQPARLAAGGLDERARLPPARNRSPVGVAADHVVDDRAVEHGAGERPGGAERPPQVRMRRGGDPAALRLEPEQPAAGARDPDRAAAVAAQPDRHHAGGHRDRRTAAGAARGAARGPRGCG